MDELFQLHDFHTVSKRTSLSRSMLYREISNPRGVDGKIGINPDGRLKVVYIGRAIRVSEQDLRNFIDALGKAQS